MQAASEPEPGEAPAGLELFESLVALLAILRRRWVWVGSGIVVGACAAIALLGVLEPRYRAVASLVIHARGLGVLDDVRSLRDDEAPPGAYKQFYQTQREILASRRVAGSALDRLGIADDPVFLGIASIRSESERAAKRAKIDPVERLRQIVRIEEVKDSRVVRVSVDYPDPARAADIANAVVHAYLDFVNAARTDEGSRAKDTLASERASALANLRAAERRLDEFKRSHEITSISLEDRQSLVTQSVLTLSARAKAAQAERIERQAVYDQARKLDRRGDFAAATMLSPADRALFDSLRSESYAAERELAEVSTTHLDKMPDVRRARSRLGLAEAKLSAHKAELIAALKARAEAARATELMLERALEAERQRALELAQLEPEYRDLEREVAAATTEYDRLTRRDSEVGLSNRVEPLAPVEILDEATVPAEPVYPRKALVLAIGLALGLLAGVAASLIADILDARIRSGADLERGLAGAGIGLLAQLPILPADARLGAGNLRAQKRQRDLYSHLFPHSLMAERCRILRAAITFQLSPDERRGIAVMVTSPSSGEGKSATVLNLAISYAQAGRRTIVVDADLRRPRIYQVFDLRPELELKGLSGVLTGACTLDEAIVERIDRETAPGREGPPLPEQLAVLPSGPIPEHPAELLEQPATRQLIASLLERYEVVLIDTPPVLPVSDPMLIATHVDGVLMVARCGVTTRAELAAAMHRLRQGDTNLLGGVLNHVDPRAEPAGYGAGAYAYGYGRGGYRAAPSSSRSS